MLPSACRGLFQLFVETLRRVGVSLGEALAELSGDLFDPPEPGTRQGDGVFSPAPFRDASVTSRAYSLSSAR